MKTFWVSAAPLTAIDAVLFTSYHNINFYSDFLYCSFGRFYGLAVTHDLAADHVGLVSAELAPVLAQWLAPHLA